MSDTDRHEPAQAYDREVDSLSFEEAFGRLGEMATSLEDGGLTLADATARYEEGMSLVRRCNKLLDEAELKITGLKDSYAASQTDQGLAEEV
jgi:exodeoxyribonuclease VII small subunit